MRLETLTQEEVYVLLTRLAEVFAAHHKTETSLTPEDLQGFMQEVAYRLGADQLLTPREVVRDFIAALNLVRQNPGVSFGQIVHGPHFQPSSPGRDPDAEPGGQFAEFRL